MTDHRSHGRLDDGVLVRALDGEAVAEDLALVEAAGDAGATRSWELRESSVRFSELVEAVPIPPLPEPIGWDLRAGAGEHPAGARADGHGPDRPHGAVGPAAGGAAATTIPRLRHPVTRRHAVLRAAGVALLLSAGAAAAMPATRAAIVGVIQRITIRPTGEGGGVAVPARATVTLPGAPSRFSVEVQRTQAAGALVVERHGGSGVTVETDGDTELLVLPDGIVVRNAATDRGDVIVRVPASVEAVSVRVGDAPTTVAPGPTSTRIALSDGGG